MSYGELEHPVTTARRLSASELACALSACLPGSKLAIRGHIEALEAELRATDGVRQLEADAKKDAVLRFEAAREMHVAAEADRDRLRAEVERLRAIAKEAEIVCRDFGDEYEVRLEALNAALDRAALGAKEGT